MATKEIPIIPDPTDDEALALFKAIEEQFPSKTLGDDKWYLLLLAAMVGGGQFNFVPLLYKQLIQRPEYQTSEQRKALMRRIREALVKLVPIVGVCKPLDAIFCINDVTAPEDKDYSFSREGWQCDEANSQRGNAWLSKLYQHNLTGINDVLASHKDFGWISKQITYGLYLSDHSILSGIESELVVIAGIMIQNLPRETAWHMRAIRRLGNSMEDVETLQQNVELIARFCGLRLHKLPRVADVEWEV
ncbi:hypothetical protein PTMSG1_02559 [Pyrenophora teres f. maculata]|nr:hypothetical protein PTMSG1_02559 [Pyrenophora teres f. maculata]